MAREDEEELWQQVLTRANCKIAAAHYKFIRGEGKHPAQVVDGAFKRRAAAEKRLAEIRRERALGKK